MKKRIVFGITSLDYGGIEISLVDLVNKLVNYYDITVLTLYSGGDLIPKINRKVKIESIYKHKYLTSTNDQRRKTSLKLMLAGRTIYNAFLKNKYDVEIAFMEGPMTMFMSIPNEKVKKIAWVHTNISKNQTGIKKHLKKGQNNKVYSNYDKIIFSGNIVQETFNKYYYVNVPQYVIPNYIDISRVIKGSKTRCPMEFTGHCKKFLIVTKLEKTKGIERLLIIHKRLLVDGYDNKMYIIGDGPLYNTLNKNIEKLGVENSFILLGKKDNPYSYIKYADGIIFATNTESYGLSVLESMILGKKILSTSSSVVDRFKEYPSIILVKNDEQSIYTGLKYMINNKEKTVKVNFKVDNKEIINSINDLITN